MTKPIVTAVGRLLKPKGNEPRVHKVIAFKADGGELDLSGQMDSLGYACWQMAGITAWQTKGHNRRSGLAVKPLRFS